MAIEPGYGMIPVSFYHILGNLVEYRNHLDGLEKRCISCIFNYRYFGLPRNDSRISGFPSFHLTIADLDKIGRAFDQWESSKDGAVHCHLWGVQCLVCSDWSIEWKPRTPHVCWPRFSALSNCDKNRESFPNCFWRIITASCLLLLIAVRISD
jgi:hypothetical protein